MIPMITENQTETQIKHEIDTLGGEGGGGGGGALIGRYGSCGSCPKWGTPM